MDRLFDRSGEIARWSDPRIDTRHTHGTGCTLGQRHRRRARRRHGSDPGHRTGPSLCPQRARSGAGTWWRSRADGRSRSSLSTGKISEIPAFAGMTRAGIPTLRPWRGPASSSRRSIPIRSPAWTRRAARRWPGRWWRRRWCSTGAAFRAGSTIRRCCPRATREAICARLYKVAVVGVGIATRRGDRPAQHLLGADAGDEPGGRRARARSGDGAGRRQSLPALGAALAGDRRRRHQMPLDRRRLDRRQGDARPDDARLCARRIPAMAGRPTRAIRRPSMPRRSARSGRRRCIAAASRRSGNLSLGL